MTRTSAVRWGIVGTANIARAAFLPALRAAGGIPVERAMHGYQSLIDDPAVDAAYIALPNSLHAEWTKLREIQSDFHFRVGRPDNIRMSADLEGGALRDVGCYPVRLAQEFFGRHAGAWAAREMGGQGVDVETWGSLGYPDGRRLMFSCGMRRGYDTFSRLLGTHGQIHVGNPFHPGPGDQLTLYPDGEPSAWTPQVTEPSFAAALRHINAVLAGAEQPRLLAVDTSLATALALRDLAA